MCDELCGIVLDLVRICPCPFLIVVRALKVKVTWQVPRSVKNGDQVMQRCYLKSESEKVSLVIFKVTFRCLCCSGTTS